MMDNDSKYIWQNKNWTTFTWDSDVLLPLLGKARQAQGQMLAKVKPWKLHLEHEAQAEILTEEVVKTSAIEGEVLSRSSVRSSVVRHLGLSEAGLSKANRHIDGLVEILLDAARNYDKQLTDERLHSWHAALFPTGYSGLHKIRVGQWRTESVRVVSGAIGREKVHFQAPPANSLVREMRGFFRWWNKSYGQVEGFLRAGIAHFWFVTIHPFDDGNGRISRALTDMALAQDEKLSTRFYSLSSQIMEERKTYYAILEKTSRERGKGDISEWLAWFFECLARAIERSKDIIAHVFAIAEFWRYHAQTQMNQRQQKVVNRLLDAGKGKFHGGLTTKKYAALTKTSRATAFREISDLLSKKVLRQSPSGKGRSVSYELDWSELPQ